MEDSMSTIWEWQLWMHPYPSLIKSNGKRLLPGLRPDLRHLNNNQLVNLSDLFEERKKKHTPVQLKRCVRAVAKKHDGDVSKAFAICTAQLQKGGYLKVGSQKPTKAGQRAGRSKAAERGHAGKVSDYEELLARARGESIDGLHEAEGGFSKNVATVPLDKARKYAEGVFQKAGKSLDKELPDFNERYKVLQKRTKAALNVPRIDMPVIEPKDMKEFDARLKSGSLDIFSPYARGKFVAPKNLDKQKGEEWVKLGVKDGSDKDDVVMARWTSVPAKKLLPTQSQIWLEKLAGNIAKWGPPKAGSPVLGTTIIVSKEGYILDGHHRFGQVMLANPDLRIKALFIPLPIKLLLKIGRSYGNAVGNQQKG
jgi:hypothetical protein